MDWRKYITICIDSKGTLEFRPDKIEGKNHSTDMMNKSESFHSIMFAYTVLVLLENVEC